MNENAPIGRVRSLTEPPVAPPRPADMPPTPSGLATPPVGPAPRPAFKPRTDDGDEFGRAMAAEVRQAPAPPPMSTSFKRQKDDEVEAELEALMGGFDAADMVVNTPGRTRAEDRSHVPKGNVGQEGTPGVQQARVVAVRGKTVFLDLGAKSEGIVPLEQFEGEPVPDKGTIIEVVFDRYDPAEGLLLMSRKGAAVAASWENLRKGLVVEAKVTKVNKGGVDVEVDGIRGFMPISQLEIGRVEDASTYIGQKLKVLVTEANQREKNLVVSRRDLLEREREEMKVKTWAELEEGQTREGTIRSVKDFGAFVDLGGVDGLLHVADMSWVRTSDVASLVHVGQRVQVKVLKVDRETNKVNLGLKQLMSSPWDDIEDRFARGQSVSGKVTRLMDFGAFVELEPGIEGLIHISELAAGRVVRARDVVKAGDPVEVRILKIEPEAKRISLSLRPLPASQTTAAPEPDDDNPPPPKPERKIPLKGGLGDKDPDPFTAKT